MPEWEMTFESEIREYNGIKYQFCIYDRADYEICSVYTPKIPQNDFDMVVTVKTFNDFKTVSLRMSDGEHLNAYVYNWEYLHYEKNIIKFLEKVKEYKEKNEV